MKRLLKVKASILTILVILAISVSGQEVATIDWQAVDEAMGVKGEMQEGNVYKFTMPRADLQVTSSGVDIDPNLSLGSWLAFKPLEDATDQVLMMGDLVLTEEEYNSVISQLQEGGIGQTAIHKHLLDSSPPIWWTHVVGQGNPTELANAVHTALEQTGTPLGASGGGNQPQNLGLDTAQLDEIIGHQGKASGGVYKYSIPHAGTITARGTEIPASMGTAVALGFQPMGNGQVAINGDFVMTEDEVNPVIEALRNNNIMVVSLHNHMLTEEPRLFFMHFWQVGDPAELARGLRAALNQVETGSTQ